MPAQPGRDGIESVTGKIAGCAACSAVCGYQCCQQFKPGSPLFRRESCIQLYPGEWEQQSQEMRDHLDIVGEDQHGGMLAYCDPERFDQTRCDPSRNFKPLDCQSYPFAPMLRDGALVLVVDSRYCPLGREALTLHYQVIYDRWSNLLRQDARLTSWIGSLPLNGYSDWGATADRV